ncbi:hypothetical protein ACSBR1_001686 [Camellia fascicularis]
MATFQLDLLRPLDPHWDVVGPRVCRAVKSFFNSGILLKELNQTNLILIPKVAALEKLSQYRSINLCNFSMKIITKALAIGKLPLFPTGSFKYT